MPDSDDAWTLRTYDSLAKVPAKAWDACAGDENPFVSHAFLLALEESGSATAETGWLGQHLALEDAAGQLIGCVPLYLKNHSYGEYVFDWGWADAYERAGGRYYPKLQSSVPFTPVTGPRILVRPGPDRARAEELLMQGLQRVAELHKVSSLHLTFPTEREWQALGEAGYLQRQGLQFHWHNQDYETFDDFLGALASRKRKAIKKERREAQESGLTIRALRGAEITERHWDAFHRFYLATIDKKWSQNYLTRSFFPLLGERLGDSVLLIVAENQGEPVAAALNLVGKERLFGRNWGCSREVRFLHFECCYYQAIEWAIGAGLKVVEAGAQGQHKVQRGYLPVPTYSAHWIADEGFRAAVADFLRREQRAVGQEIDFVTEMGPFRKPTTQL
ncbi:MAG: GNAT family N-acetyltransferase [Pseudomonadota bacterium]